MSIPKEPRQLMINIMYLVLTALLALNVSAEIFNAFKILDRGLVKSNLALDFSTEPMQKAIFAAAKAKPSFQTYANRVVPIRDQTKSLTDFISGIRDSIISSSGGYMKDPDTQAFTNELLGAKNIEATTRVLVDNPAQAGINDAQGEELKKRLEKYKLGIVKFIDEPDKMRFQKEIAVSIDDQTWRKEGKASWAHMNFNKMPVQAVIPMINKYINDVKSTEAAALSYLGKKVGIGKDDVILNDFTVVAAPEQSYVIKGDPYNADIFLTAFAGPDSGTKVKLSVNGQPLNLDAEGRGQYKVNTSVAGPKTYTATAQVFNPVTEKTQTYTKEFTYEVGERSVAISPTKMNVFYVGVDNPVEISAAGANSNTMSVNMSGAGNGEIKRKSDGSYVVNVETPTRRDEFAKVNVMADGVNTSKNFRVKRIPDPVPKLSDSKSGGMASGVFKVQVGIFPELENFDFEAECDIQEFKLVRVPKRDDPRVSINIGGRYTEESKALVAKAKPGDKYFYEDIKCKCPGDIKSRDLGVMVFRIR